MDSELISTFMQLLRATLSTWLFIIAGTILVVSHPKWPGSWVLLVGAIILSALSGVRLIGLLPRETDVWLLIAFEAGDTLGYMLAGLGAVLVSMRAREKPG